VLLASSPLAWAQPSCGKPPVVADESLKGELGGKAQLLTRWVGNADFKGQVEAARNDVFSKYPEARQTRSDDYLLYMFCSFVLRDPNFTGRDKQKAILEMRQALAADAAAHTGPRASSKGKQSPAQISGGNSSATYGTPAAPAPVESEKPGTAVPSGTATTKGEQSPAQISGGNSSATYGNPPSK
jgi:hypothetical protein